MLGIILLGTLSQYYLAHSIYYFTVTVWHRNHSLKNMDTCSFFRLSLTWSNAVNIEILRNGR